MDEKNKVKALKDSIVEECRKQGFTIDEFSRLVGCLRFIVQRRLDEVYKETKL